MKKEIKSRFPIKSGMTFKIGSIHFVGIKGVGMTPLAIIAKEAGFNVSGSDIKDKFITDESLAKAGIKPLIGFLEKHIGNVDLVITTGAHGGFYNKEVIEAKRRNIKVITQGEAVGVFMEGGIFNRRFKGISVTGTHGKTTTTAVITTILKESGFDPSYVVGTGFVPSLGLPGHYGKGKYFVAEADEYMTEPTFDKTIKHMWQHPEIAVITNIEFDHPDAYKSIDDTREAFLKFANQLPENGVLIACGDDPQVRKLLLEFEGRKITYGFSKENDYIVNDIKFINTGMKFTIDVKDSSTEFISSSLSDLGVEDPSEVEGLEMTLLSVFGNHNALNATASIITSLELGISIDKIQKALLKFTGSKRRSEYIGQLLSGAKLFDDYGHHPTKIKATLAAFRSRFPKLKIVCIFQPHTYSRTKSLFEQFVRSFYDADSVIITNIYASLREKKDPTVSSKFLASAMSRSYKGVVFLPELQDVVEYIDKKRYGEDTVVITMGAGDIYKINEKLILRPASQRGEQAQEKN